MKLFEILRDEMRKFGYAEKAMNEAEVFSTFSTPGAQFKRMREMDMPKEVEDHIRDYVQSILTKMQDPEFREQYKKQYDKKHGSKN